MVDEKRLEALRQAAKSIPAGEWAPSQAPHSGFCYVTNEAAGVRMSLGRVCDGLLAFVARSLTDGTAVLADLDEAARLIHDLRQESEAYQRGYQDANRRAVELVKDRHAGHRAREADFKSRPDLPNAKGWEVMNCCQADTLEGLLTDIGEAGGQPSPPDLVRAENARLRSEAERLRAALRQILDVGDHGPGADRLPLVIAREALGEA